MTSKVVKRHYSQRPGLVGLVLGIATLGALLPCDRLLGHPVALRYTYLLPIWLATRLGGRAAGLGVAVVTSLVLATVDPSADHVTGFEPLFLNFIMRLITLSLVTLLIARVEDGMRRYNRLARTDSLTGLHNRRAFGDLATHALDRARRLRKPLTLVLVDCDRFKQVNDRFGHAAGDDVLRTIARILEQDARASDLVARIGGDEFVVLLPNTSRVGAKIFMERIQTDFAREAALLGCDVALSAGVAELGVDGHSLGLLLDRADREMYSRKPRQQLAAVTAHSAR